ncbi:MAG: NAD-dependent epimerase [Desulfovibrio sp.]|nr:NAD-dependent epimerase [Desulfovibrio sp.]MCA1986215.1 NAD-dependent epimerase [Desulfovibrio sp.]
MRICITGAAGFIGYHLSEYFASRGVTVVGIDNLNEYYDVTLKQARLDALARHPSFQFARLDLADKSALRAVFANHGFTHVMNLAAQAGVRYSLENPDAYIASNVVGFHNLLECCRAFPVEHFVYASSSSVYGLNTRMPFSVHDNVDHPVSLYAASKKSNELMAHVYSHLYAIPTTGLRFFTVYGPWGRPDMALFLFTKAMLAGEPIKIFNQGNMRRDFTYIDDIIEGVVRVLAAPPAPNAQWSGEHPDPSSSPAPYRIFNIGNNNSVSLMEFIRVLEQALGMEARKEFLPMQPGDVPATFANIDDLHAAVGFRPSTPLEVGIPRFVSWYIQRYGR